MIPHWLFGSQGARWEACMAHFDRHGMALPIVPDCLEQVLRHKLRAEGPGCFATPGWRMRGDWSDLIDDWVRHADPVRAWLRVRAEGQEPLVEVSLVTPVLGVFMRHRWSRWEDADPIHLKVAEAHRSAAQLLWDAEKLVRGGRWPQGQRLLLIDDELDLPRWGWVDGSAEVSDVAGSDIRIMKVSHAMYLEVMAVMDGLHHHGRDALLN